MTYDEALTFWYGRINYEVRSAKPGDLKLERMRALLKLLGDPHDRVRLVHVTGTKGKGSTCAMLAAVLRATKYRVGLFTSPHLEHVEERIQVDGKPITRDELAARMTDVAAAVIELERNAPEITFFEIVTAFGFLHFCYRRCDVAVIEVGLGGRFDSTNVCHPLVSIITNIGLDHTAQLGTTLEEIAYQKAGIIKHGVPVVSGVNQPGAREVVRHVATEMNAPLWEVAPRAPRFKLGLLGTHQHTNAETAVVAIERLRSAGMPISEQAIALGMANVRWPARVELISERPAIILDMAHNVPSAEALVKALQESVPTSGRKVVVFAVSADKDYREILRVLTTYFDQFHLTRFGSNPRSVSPEKLAGVMEELSTNKRFTTHVTATEAWHAARSEASEADLVCVTGSVFLAGELRAIVMGKSPE